MFLNSTEVNFEHYDVIIAGSGFAGLFLAKRLASHGKKALILETGARDYDDVVQTQFTAMYGRGHYDGSHWAGHWVRALGGTSSIWGGWCIPLTERNLGRWPISLADLNPYYLVAARELRRDPSFIKFAAPFVDGFVYKPISVDFPVRLSEDAGDFYAESENAHFVLGATLSQLRARPDRQAVASFSLFTEADPERMIRLREGQSLVLAAGGIGNAQILLSSDAADGPAVGNERDQVGRRLMEHPEFNGCGRIIVPAALRLPSVPSGFGDFTPLITPDDALLEEIGGLDVGIDIEESELNPHDSVERYLAAQMGGAARAYDLRIRSEMPADPMNRLTVAEGRDPAGLRRLRALCAIDTAVFRNADACLAQLGAVLTASGPGRLRIANDALYREVMGGGHIMGTTCMGDNPGTSVVDRDCRVHGYRNLFIAGSSVFPSGGYANPTFTIIALATRLADKLSGAA